MGNWAPGLLSYLTSNNHSSRAMGAEEVNRLIDPTNSALPGPMNNGLRHVSLPSVQRLSHMTESGLKGVILTENFPIYCSVKP